MNYLLSSLVHDPIVQVIAHEIMWREYLALLPLFVGIAVTTLVNEWFASDSVTNRVLIVLCVPLCCVLFYAGITDVAAAMDIGEIFDPKFATALAIAYVQLAAGMGFAWLAFVKPAARLLEDEKSYSDRLSKMIENHEIIAR